MGRRRTTIAVVVLVLFTVAAQLFLFGRALGWFEDEGAVTYAAGRRLLPAGHPLVCVDHRLHAGQWTWRSVGSDATRGDS
jgi:hypothetical protein